MSSAIIRSFILSACLVLLPALCAPSRVLAEGVDLWRFEVVDSGGVTGFCTSVGLDSQGKACISYYDITAQRVQVASRTVDGGWLIEPLSLCGG
jgi:hypothetical protein